jgi:TfoX/Sxy family transcriptional regulator of competence genes
MTVNDDLAEAVRAALSGAGAIREVKMFGGTCFMLNGNMVAGLSKRGLLMRVGKNAQKDALARPGARPMEMRGRTLEGYIYVDPAELTGSAVKSWLHLALAFVRTLPPKEAGSKPALTKAKQK